MRADRCVAAVGSSVTYDRRTLPPPLRLRLALGAPEPASSLLIRGHRRVAGLAPRLARLLAL